MHVRHYARNIAALFRRRLGAPGFGRQILQKVLVDTVVGIKGREQSFG